MFLSIKNYCHGPYRLYDSLGNAQELSEISSRKWFPTQIIDREENISHDAIPTQIVGIIDFTNRTSAGLTPRGIPMYFFFPINPAYPTFVVSAKVNPRENMLAQVSYEHWEDKRPRGGVQRILGAVGNVMAEAAALIQAAGIPKKPAIPTVVPLSPRTVPPYWDRVFNIDPAGCADVDDVFCWRNDGTLGIAIADVASWVAEGDPCDLYARELGQTIYVDGIPSIPMLPVAISETAASLRCDGTTRSVLTAIWLPSAEAPTWEIQHVALTRCYSYESAVGSEDLMLVTAALRALGTPTLAEEPHGVVEHAMILYNTFAARALRAKGVGLLRTHDKMKNTEFADIALKSGCAEIAHMGSSAGRYVPGCTSGGHSGLGLDVYCHATSPLRRYADLVNQRWLKHILCSADAPTTHLHLGNRLNWRNQIVKQLDRDLYFLQNLQPNSITTVSGIVLRVLSDRGIERISIYVPMWRRKVTVRRPVTTNVTIPEIGSNVALRAYCNLRATNWHERLVCSID